MMDIYSINADRLNGQKDNLEVFKGKVMLVVNTASNCGFTPQYEGLELLNKKYKEEGLEILGFPCNQFGKQEPGTNKEIAQGCLINYGVSFTMFSKIDVNGPQEHALFRYLKNKKGALLGKNIRWNFTKFLIDKKGNVIKRFSPWTKPAKIEKYIKSLL